MQGSILYVDDEPINLLIFERVIGKHFPVTTADSGSKALTLLHEVKGEFRAIVSDLTMPEMDGYEFLAHSRDAFPGIPRFILTAHFQNEQILEAIASGLALAWFQKPLQPDRILNAIHSYVHA